MIRAAILYLFLAGSASAQLLQLKNDYLIVPGVRVGPFASDTGHAGIRRVFGAANVADQMIDSEDDSKAPGTVVYRGDKNRELEILWKDNNPKNPPAALYFCRSGTGRCLWHTQNGITMGTTMLKLEELNGKPFEITGFFSDYGGQALWNGGKLEKEMKKGGRLVLYLSITTAVQQSLAPKDLDAIRGEGKTLRSDNPLLRKINPVVQGMTLLGFER